MMQRILNSKNFLAVTLAMTTGTLLYLRLPWPTTAASIPRTWNEYFLRLIAVRDPWSYAALKASYHILLFTTPYIGFSLLLSALYIFTLRSHKPIEPQPLPPYPAVASRDHLYLVVGEIHNPRKPIPAAEPYWLTIPERGLFTGTILIGATGAGKTACSMYPFTEQLLGFKSSNAETKLGGIILEVKGDFCRKVKDILTRYGRERDYIEIGLDSKWAYNPLQNDMDGYSMASGVANLMNNLFGKGKDPFWQVAYTNFIKFIIILHKVGFGYVTLFDVYESAICPPVFERKLDEAEKRLAPNRIVTVSRSAFLEHVERLHDLAFEADPGGLSYHAADSSRVRDVLSQRNISFRVIGETEGDLASSDKRDQIVAVRRWYENDWKALKPELRSSVVEGISSFLSLFDDNPRVKRLFCPPVELYKPDAAPIKGKSALPPLGDLLEQGKVLALDFPVGMNPALARAIAVMMKLDFERAMLNRIPQMQEAPQKHWRPVVFICDEYQLLATVGQNEPGGDEQFFSLSRQARCIPIVATQSISSLRSTLPGESWRTLLQTFRSKIFFTQTDDFSAKMASELCGQEYIWKVNYNISESGHDSKVSFFTGKPLANKSNISTSKTYSQQRDYRFDVKSFTELRNAESIVLAYDGVTPLPPMFCYLKPYQNNSNKNYFLQLAEGEL